MENSFCANKNYIENLRSHKVSLKLILTNKFGDKYQQIIDLKFAYINVDIKYISMYSQKYYIDKISNKKTN